MMESGIGGPQARSSDETIEVSVGRDGAALSVEDPTWVEILGFVVFVGLVVVLASPWWRKPKDI